MKVVEKSKKLVKMPIKIISFVCFLYLNDYDNETLSKKCISRQDHSM